MQALVLAGQANRGRLLKVSSVRWEAEIPVAGRPMVTHVLDALQEATMVDQTVMVGPAVASHPWVVMAPMADDVWGNLMSGLGHLPRPHEPVLVITSDIPLVTGQLIDAFVQSAPAADVVYPVVSKTSTEHRFPHTRRTYVRFRDGVFTGGNLFILDPGKILELQRHAQILLSHRKSPWKLAQDIGWGLLMKLLLGRLSLEKAEHEVSRLLGIRGRVVVFDFPEIGVDVDKPEDLWLVERRLQGLGRSNPAENGG